MCVILIFLLTNSIMFNMFPFFFFFFYRSDADNNHFCWIGVTNPKPFLLPVSGTRTIHMYAAVASQGCYKTTSKLNILARPHTSIQHAFLTQIVSSSSLLVIKDHKYEVIS